MEYAVNSFIHIYNFLLFFSAPGFVQTVGGNIYHFFVCQDSNENEMLASWHISLLLYILCQK